MLLLILKLKHSFNWKDKRNKKKNKNRHRELKLRRQILILIYNLHVKIYCSGNFFLLLLFKSFVCTVHTHKHHYMNYLYALHFYPSNKINVYKWIKNYLLVLFCFFFLFCSFSFVLETRKRNLYESTYLNVRSIEQQFKFIHYNIIYYGNVVGYVIFQRFFFFYSFFSFVNLL